MMAGKGVNIDCSCLQYKK